MLIPVMITISDLHWAYEYNIEAMNIVMFLIIHISRLNLSFYNIFIIFWLHHTHMQKKSLLLHLTCTAVKSA